MRTIPTYDKDCESSSPKFFSRRPSSSGNELPLRGIHINISSDPFQHRIHPYLQRLWQESKLRRRLSLLKRRLQKRYRASSPAEMTGVALVAFFSALFLLVHVGFFSGKKYQDWQSEHYGRLEEIDLLDKLYPEDGRSLTTAVVLFQPEASIAAQQKATETMVPLLEYLCQYEMFSSIVIWHQHPDMMLTPEMFKTTECPSNKVSVYNPPKDMQSSARYLACASTKNPYCYFQDDTKHSRHLRSLYANFLRTPSLVHGESLTTADYVDTQWTHCFMNQEVNLHACHISLGAGTFVSRETIEKFIHALEKDTVESPFKDMYFMAYTNQVPYQLECAHSPSQATPSLSQPEKDSMHHGLQLAMRHLENKQDLVSWQEEVHPASKRYVRSPCHDDRCLFMTNIESLPDPQLFSYRSYIDVHSFERMHTDYYNSSHFITHAYSNAVDGKDDSAWKSSQNIKVGDFIGLDLLMPIRMPVKYRFLARHPYSYRRTMNLQMSFDGVVWINIHPTPSIECSGYTRDTGTDMSLLECYFVIRDTGYRFIRLESLQAMDFTYEVYDLSFSAKVKRDENGQLLDIETDDKVAFIEE
ncbi:hypothetical protein BDF14DRAFT_1816930 [Spinellus fusiger]|nr:hypothetical protein BDF14DRAFT_1816930 [Spinellus fusiger]